MFLVVTGGAALHLIHSAYLSKIKLIPTVHEQAAAMAADSYSRITELRCCICNSKAWQQ